MTRASRQRGGAGYVGGTSAGGRGSKTLTDVDNFYNQHFSIGLTAEEIRKVVLFLQQT